MARKHNYTISELEQKIAAIDEKLKPKWVSGWAFQKDRPKGIFRPAGPLFWRLPPEQQVVAQRELNRLVDRCRREGRALDRYKWLSLIANATHIAKNVRTGKMMSWSRRVRRLKGWKHLYERLLAEKKEEIKRKENPVPRHGFISLEGI